MYTRGGVCVCVLGGGAGGGGGGARVSSAANFITAYEESQSNWHSHFLSTICSLFPKTIF